ncbi:hypothetical protein AAEO50_00655 [Rossellomorea oryzaecorticis]|uniref:Uncharacterized protein n=1 Tax=Rossellomorea oryzaecorticis TaxID=1396505 RepID=A0ABU9K3W0_9BACI
MNPTKLFSVISKHAENKLYKIPNKIFKNKSELKNILIYPEFHEEKQLAEFLNKLAWYLPNYGEYKIEIIAKGFDVKNTLYKIPDHQYKFLDEELLSHLKIRDSKENISSLTTDLILVWDKKEMKKLPFKLVAISKIVDPNFYSHTESSNFRELFFETLNKEQTTDLQSLYKRNFTNLLKENNKNRVTVFATGPSIDKAFNMDFENSFNIICNSIVKNDRLLEQIKPRIITFGDPVYHFSSNKYSTIFRNHVLKTVEKYNSYVVVPETAAPLLLRHYPELENYIIGVPKGNGINFPTMDKFYVNYSSNILTLFMLPFAASISDRIDIIGVDGREKKEKNFWKHSSSVQFDELTGTIEQAHPSFFRDRLYTEYYKRHVKYLGDIINFGEEKGKSFKTLTKSNISLLNNRREK